MHNSIFKNNNDSTCSYSIWILPDENLFAYLSSIIRKISLKYGGPIFHPHITVIGGFQGDQKNLIKKTFKFAESIDCLKIIFNGIGYHNDIFYPLFLKVLLTEELLRVRKIAEDNFKLFLGNYNPHLSLTYGNYEDHQKLEMLDVIKEVPACFIANKICLAKNNERKLKWEIIDSFNC